MFREIFQFNKIKRVIKHAAYLLLCVLIQMLVFSRLQIFSVKAFFLPTAVVAVSLYEGGVYAGWFGLAMGVFGDICLGTYGLCTVLFPLIGVCCGAISVTYINRSFFGFICLSLASMAVFTFCQLFNLLISLEHGIIALIWTGFMQTILSLAAGYFAYILCEMFSETEL